MKEAEEEAAEEEKEAAAPAGAEGEDTPLPLRSRARCLPDIGVYASRGHCGNAVEDGGGDAPCSEWEKCKRAGGNEPIVFPHFGAIPQSSIYTSESLLRVREVSTPPSASLLRSVRRCNLTPLCLHVSWGSTQRPGRSVWGGVVCRE